MNSVFFRSNIFNFINTFKIITIFLVLFFQTSFAAQSSSYKFKDFSDVELEVQLKKHSASYIYVWSTRMPLSIKGAKHIYSLSAELDIPVIFLNEQYDNLETVQKTVRENPFLLQKNKILRFNSVALQHNGALLHFPSLSKLENQKLRKKIVVGYKEPEVYRYFLLKDNWQLQTNAKSLSPSTVNISMAFNKKVDLLQKSISPFFKNIPGKNSISYSKDGKNYIHSFSSQTEILAPGKIDPVPSPDGIFLTMPSLNFYKINSILTQQDQSPLVFTDPDLKGQYQTLGILEQNREETLYRAVTGWGNTSMTRNYLYNHVDEAITPLGNAKNLCEGRQIALPMISKNGQLLAAIDLTTKTTKIINITAQGECGSDFVDLGMATGKVSFSNDSKFITFSIIEYNSPDFNSNVYVHRLGSDKVFRLSLAQEISGLVFPEFTDDFQLMVLRAVHRRSDPSLKVDTIYFVDLKEHLDQLESL